MDTPVLITERLILRKFEESDLEAVYKIYSDTEVNKFLPWFPLKTIGETKVFYEAHLVSRYNQKCAYHYAVCLKKDNYPIGYVNVGAVEQLKKDNIPYITATHDVNNPRSGGVMKRLGMKYQYSYEELWQSKDILVIFRMYQLNLDGNECRVYKEYWNNSTVHFVETDI